MQKRFIYLALFSSALLLSSCGGASGSASHSNPIIEADKVAQVYLDQLGIVPLVEGSQGSFLLRINNDTNKHYTLEGITLRDIGSKEAKSSLVKISASLCNKVPALSSCSIQFTPQTNKSGDTYLTVRLHDNDGEIKELHQLIRMSSQLKNSNGLNVGNDLGTVASKNGEYGVALPLVLNADFDQIKPDNGSLICNSNSYKRGNSCTLLLKGQSLNKDTLISTRIKAYQKGSVVAEAGGSILVKSGNLMANLVLSHGISLIADGADSKTVAVYNNGTGTATDLDKQLDSDSKLTLTGDCTTKTSLDSGQLCEYQVTADHSELTAAEALTVTYKSGTDNKSKSTNIVYFGKDGSPALALIPSGNLLNTFYDLTHPETRLIDLKITNTGTRKFRNIKLTKSVGHNDIKIIGSCSSSEMLVNDACDIQIEYTPSAANISGNIAIFVSADYQDRNGIWSQYNTSVGIDYSSVDTQVGSLVFDANYPTNLSWNQGTYDETIHDTILTLKNSGNPTISHVAADISSIAIDSSNRLLEQKPATTSSCTNSTVLNAGDDCTITLKPTDTALATPLTNSVAHTVKVAYTQYNNNHEATSSSIMVMVNKLAALISRQISVEPGTPYHGNGDSNSSPYSFTAISDKPLILKYTIKNTGNQSATDFRIDIDNPSTAAEIFDNSCNPNQPLAENGGECIFKLKVPSGIFSSQQIHIDYAHLYSGFFSVPLAVSYNDHQGHTTVDLGSKYFQFNRNWANVMVEPTRKTVDANGNVVVTIPVSAYSTDRDVTVTPLAPMNLAGITVTPCPIPHGSQSCEATVTFPYQSFGEDLEARLRIKITGSGLADGDAIYADAFATPFDTGAKVEVTHGIPKSRFTGILADPVLNQQYNGKLIYGAGEKLPFEIKVRDIDEAIPKVTGLDKARVQIDAAECSAAAITANGKHECTIKGVYTVADFVKNPPSAKDKYKTETFSYNFNVDIQATASRNHRSTSHSTQFSANNLLRVGYYSKDWNSNTSREFSKWYEYDFTAVPVKDDTVINGVNFFYNDINKLVNGASVIKLNARNLNSGGSIQPVYIFARRQVSNVDSLSGDNYRDHWFALNDRAYRTDGYTRLEFIRYDSSIVPDRFFTFSGDISNDLITDQAVRAEIKENNAQLPIGHYVATFFLLGSEGRLIKVSLDWNKTTPQTP